MAASTSHISKTLPRDNKVVTTCKMTGDYLVVAKETALYAFNLVDHSLTTLQEQGNVIWSLAGDDNLLVTGGTVGDLRLWDLKTKSIIRLLKGHTETVRSLQLLNKITLISGSRDSTICIWDLSSDKDEPKSILRGHTATVRCLHAHDGILVSGSYDSDARVWDLHTGECLQVLKGHAGVLYDVCFDGTQVITGGLDTDIRVWDPCSGACQAVLSDHIGLIGQLCLQGNTLVSGDNCGTIRLWSLPKGYCQTIAEDDKGDPVISLVIDGERILFGNANGSAHLVHHVSGAREALVTGADGVWSMGFTPDKHPWVVYGKGEDTWLDVFECVTAKSVEQ